MGKIETMLSILIPDGESSLLLYVVNGLSQVKGINIYVMSNKKYIPMRLSRHIKNFSFYPKTENELDWIENINQEIKEYKIDVLLPIYESGIETIIKFRGKLISEKLCLLPSIVDFTKAKNKWMLARHLLINDLPYPETALFLMEEKFRINKLKFPLIVKPVEGRGGGEGVFLFNTKDELEYYFLNNNFTNSQIVQEYVKGYDIGCSVLCKSGDILAFTIQKCTMPNTNPFRPLLGVKFVYDENLYRIVKKMMESLNWSGVAHVDLRYDIEAKVYKVIEVNTRFWGSLDASLTAGINFPYLYCLAISNVNFVVPKYNYISFLNLKGLLLSIVKDRKLLFDFSYMLNNTPLKFALKDPLPFIFKYISFTKVSLANLVKIKVGRE
ncbi:ATP-grasp domain-containing protein [Mangrovimonas xylaniphaga]|uniref:ATP-grasp domain-containing protein n=1 Tax=Mangrovimonas xylaniphaga TaxID=1645915 RepID=UPI0006B6575F|nr:ATP-grasp domain-containing protein [Mangrovimonas xylaniphaga]